MTIKTLEDFIDYMRTYMVSRMVGLNTLYSLFHFGYNVR